LVLILGRTSQDRGNEFEDFTVYLLENLLSFHVIQKRWKHSFREIDILAEDFFKRKYIIECKEFRMSRKCVSPVDVDNLVIRVIKHEEAKTGVIMTTGKISEGAYQNALLLRTRLEDLNIDVSLTDGEQLSQIYMKEAKILKSDAKQIANKNGLIGRLEVELGYFYGKPCWVVLLKQGRLIKDLMGIDARKGVIVNIEDHVPSKLGGKASS